MTKALPVLLLAFVAALLVPAGAGAGSGCTLYADMPQMHGPALPRVAPAAELHCPTNRTITVSVCAQRMPESGTAFGAPLDCRRRRLSVRANVVAFVRARPIRCTTGSYWRSAASLLGFVTADESPFLRCRTR